MPDSPLLLPPLLLAILLAVSGAAKLRHPEETHSAFVQLRVPQLLTSSGAPRLLPWAEIALAVALVLVPAPFALVVAVLTLLLLLVYLLVIVRALGFGYPVTCSCFGRLGMGEVTRRTAVRNALLVVVGLLAVWSATAPGSVLTRLVDAPATAWAWLGLVTLTVAVVVVTFGGTKGGPLASPETAPGGEDDLVEVDYARQPMPYAALVDEDGRSRPLTDLVSGGAVLLVFISPGCAPCARAIEQIPEWDDSLGPVRVRAVTSLPLETALQQVPDLSGRLLQDPQATLMRIFGVGTPGAVLLGGDGLLAGGPVRGTHDVADFIVDVRTELEEAGVLPTGEPVSDGR